MYHRYVIFAYGWLVPMEDLVFVSALPTDARRLQVIWCYGCSVVGDTQSLICGTQNTKSVHNRRYCVDSLNKLVKCAL